MTHLLDTLVIAAHDARELLASCVLLVSDVLITLTKGDQT